MKILWRNVEIEDDGEISIHMPIIFADDVFKKVLTDQTGIKGKQYEK